jgi:hypothetical protein
VIRTIQPPQTVAQHVGPEDIPFLGTELLAFGVERLKVGWLGQQQQFVDKRG